jgi:hypothetical protein
MSNVARRAITVAIFLLAASGPSRAATWTELGDAGGEFDPQMTIGVGDLTEIHGTLGDPDLFDAFLFAYDGTPGTLQISAAFDDVLLGIIPVGLFSGSGAPLLPSPFFEADGDLSVSDLASGLYVVAVNAAHGNDPPYTILFDGPGEGGGVGFASVPEPGTLSLVGAGLASLAMRRRQRRA